MEKRALWVLLWVASVLAGCGQHPPEAVAEQRSNLQAALSPTIDMEPALPTLHTQAVAPPTLACASTGCVAVYQQCFGNCYNYIARVSLAGQLTDARPIYLGGPDAESASPPTIASNGADELLLTWGEGYSDFYRARFKPSDGTFIEPPTTMAGGPELSVVSDGSSYLLTYSTGTGLAVRLLKNGVLSDSIPVPTSTSTAYKSTVTISGASGQYLVAWSAGAQGYAARFDTATLKFLDAPPIHFTQYYGYVAPQGVFVGGVYMVVWKNQTTSGGAYVLRINSAGSVLDPDDTFNGVTTAKLVGSGTLDQLRVFAKDGRAVLLWRSGAIAGVRVDPTTGTVPTGDPNPFYAGSNTGTVLNVAVGANSGLMVLTYPGDSTSTLVPLAWSTAASFGLSVLPTIVFAYEADARTDPAVATNGSTFLASWISNGQVLAARLDATSGVVLDSPALVVANADQSTAVASNGSEYVVVYATSQQMYARRISASGVLGAAPTTPIFTAPSTGFSTYAELSALHALYNGAYYWLAWGQYDTAEKANDMSTARLDPSTLTLSTPNQNVNFSALGQFYGLTGDTSPDAAHRTILVAASAGSGKVRAARVRSDSTIVQASVTVSDSAARDSSVLAASDGTTFLVAWNKSGGLTDGDLAVALLDPLSGALQAGYPKTLLPVESYGHDVSGLWYDGISYVLLMARSSHTLHVRRFSPTLGALDSADTDLESNYFNDLGNLGAPAAASDRLGHSLVVYPVPDPKHQSIVIKGRFISNDGLAWAGPSGAGGMTGVGGAGVGGAAGFGGTTNGGGTADIGGTTNGAAGSAMGGGSASATAGNGGADDSAAGDSGSPSAGVSGAPVAHAGSGATESGGSDNAAGSLAAPSGEQNAAPGGCGVSRSQSQRGLTGEVALLFALSVAGLRRRKRAMRPRDDVAPARTTV